MAVLQCNMENGEMSKTRFVCEVVVEVEGRATKRAVREWLDRAINGSTSYPDDPDVRRVFVRRDVDVQ
jgi:hypothetical protein